MYNDGWMFDQGLKKRKVYGDLRDIIARRFEDQATVFVSVDDTLQTVYNRMKSYEISQIPVLENDKIIGIVDESDLLLAIYARNYNFQTTRVSRIMSIGLTKVYPNDSIDKLIDIFVAFPKSIWMTEYQKWKKKEKWLFLSISLLQIRNDNTALELGSKAVLSFYY